MKKKLIIIGISLILSIGVFVGYGGSGTKASAEQLDIENFQIISKDCVTDFDSLITVKHKETGKRFIIYKGDKAGGIIPLD